MVPLFFSRSSKNYRHIIDNRICNLKYDELKVCSIKVLKAMGIECIAPGQKSQLQVFSAGSECQIAWFVTALLDLGEASLELATT